MSRALGLLVGAAAALTATLAPMAAHAQADAVRLHGAAPGKAGGSVGLVAIAGSRYAGSDQRRTMLLPTLDYQWGNGWFAGVGWSTALTPSMRLSLGAGLTLANAEHMQSYFGVTAGLSVTTLLGDAQDSPLTRRKSAASGLLALRYGF